MYDGMFEHGAMCYNGTYRSATSVFEGVWKNNIRNGYVSICMCADPRDIVCLFL